MALTINSGTYNADLAALFNSKARFCLAFWYYLDDDDPGISVYNVFQVVNHALIRGNNPDSWVFYTYPDGANGDISPLRLTRIWHFYVLRYDGAAVTMYRDGVQLGTVARTSAMPAATAELILNRVTGTVAKYGPVALWTGDTSDDIPTVAALDAYYRDEDPATIGSITPAPEAHWTLSGTDTNPASIAATGGAYSLTGVSPNSTLDTTMPAVQTAEVEDSYIANSGRLLVVRYKRSSDDVAALIAGAANDITVHTPGGDVSAERIMLRANDRYVHYVLPADSVEAGETITWSAPALSVQTSAGSSAAVVNFPATNRMGTNDTLPAVADLPAARIPVITNAGGESVYYLDYRRYANDARQSSGWTQNTGTHTLSAQGYPILSSPSTAGRLVWFHWDSTPIDWDFTLWWGDAEGAAGTSDIVCITGGGSVTETEGKTWDATRSMWRRKYTGGTNAIVQVLNSGAGITNIEMCPDDYQATMLAGQMYTDWYNEIHGGVTIQRIMDALPTNVNANPVTSDHLTPADWFGAEGKTETITAAIASITATTDASLTYAFGGTVLAVETTAPHGLHSGQTVRITGGNYTIGGATVTRDSWIRVLSDTTFNIVVPLTGTLAGSTPGNAVCVIRYGSSIEDICAELEEGGVNRAWITLPHACDDSYVTAVCTRLLASLPATVSEVIFEMSNEIWNYSAAYLPQLIYFAMMGKNDGNISKYQWYAKRTSQVRALAQAVLGSKAKVVLSGQFANHTGTLKIAVDYAVANSLDFDYISVASYFGNAVGAGIDGLGASGAIDWLETEIRYSWANTVATIGAYITSVGKPLLPYEGGSHIVAGTNTDLQALHKQINLHPRFAKLYWLSWTLLQEAGWGGVNQFGLVSGWGTGQYGIWSAYQRNEEPSGVGDGSDGKHNNLTDLDTATSVSVKGYAMSAWAEGDPEAGMYTYEYSLDGGDPVSVGVNTQVIVTGLTGGVEYSLRVRSKNASDEYSDWSAAVAETALEPDTTAPTVQQVFNIIYGGSGMGLGFD